MIRAAVAIVKQLYNPGSGGAPFSFHFIIEQRKWGRDWFAWGKYPRMVACKTGLRPHFPKGQMTLMQRSSRTQSTLPLYGKGSQT